MCGNTGQPKWVTSSVSGARDCDWLVLILANITLLICTENSCCTFTKFWVYIHSRLAATMLLMYSQYNFTYIFGKLMLKLVCLKFWTVKRPTILDITHSIPYRWQQCVLYRWHHHIMHRWHHCIPCRDDSKVSCTDDITLSCTDDITVSL